MSALQHGSRGTDIVKVVQYALLGGCLVFLAGLFISSAQGRTGKSDADQPPRYAPPSLAGYTFVQEDPGDGNGDGIDETRIRRFRSPAGDQVFTMTTSHKLWAWSLDTQGDDDSDVSRNFVIRDSDCNGVFDERYRLDQEFKVPPCLE